MTTPDQQNEPPDLRLLPGPATGPLYRSPRFATSGPGEIRIRVIRRPEGLVIHITAPDPEVAERTVRELFGEDQACIIELCG